MAPALRLSERADNVHPSRPMSEPKPVPRASRSRAIASASRVFVPSSSMARLNPASPGASGGSELLPARTASCAVTTGRTCDSTRYTGSPFSRTNRLALGSGAVDMGPGLGTSFRHGSWDSTWLATFGGAGGVGGAGGSTFSPGSTWTTTRWSRPRWVATKSFTEAAVTAS